MRNILVVIVMMMMMMMTTTTTTTMMMMMMMVDVIFLVCGREIPEFMTIVMIYVAHFVSFFVYRFCRVHCVQC